MPDFYDEYRAEARVLASSDLPPRPEPGYRDGCGRCGWGIEQDATACVEHATDAEKAWIERFEEITGNGYRAGQYARWELAQADPTLF